MNGSILTGNSMKSPAASLKTLLTVIISRISLFDESIRGIEAKDCTYRIYRDTRFSEDKTPYKTHLGGYINAKGKKSDHCGYYVHLEPGNCLLAGGSYCPPPPLLRALRQAVHDNIDEFRSIVEDPAFKQYFPVIGENFPKKSAPKWISKGLSLSEYLSVKSIRLPAASRTASFLLQTFWIVQTTSSSR